MTIGENIRPACLWRPVGIALKEKKKRLVTGIALMAKACFLG